VATTAAASLDTTIPPPTPAPVTAPPAPPSPPGATTGCTSVVHLGDSTSVGMVSAAFIPDPALRLDGQYARVGVTDRHLEISGARSIQETHGGNPNAANVARSYKAAGYEGCWVFALGTTDSANVAAGSRVGIDRRIDTMMSVVGDDPVLWVTVKTLRVDGPWRNEAMQAWNAALVAATARYPNLRLFDWAAVVPDAWFGSDLIHYTAIGFAERARLIADALAATYPKQ
jgi:hypothetical protein